MYYKFDVIVKWNKYYIQLKSLWPNLKTNMQYIKSYVRYITAWKQTSPTKTTHSAHTKNSAQPYYDFKLLGYPAQLLPRRKLLISILTATKVALMVLPLKMNIQTRRFYLHLCLNYIIMGTGLLWIQTARNATNIFSLNKENIHVLLA